MCDMRYAIRDTPFAIGYSPLAVLRLPNFGDDAIPRKFKFVGSDVDVRLQVDDQHFGLREGFPAVHDHRRNFDQARAQASQKDGVGVTETGRIFAQVNQLTCSLPRVTVN